MALPKWVLPVAGVAVAGLGVVLVRRNRTKLAAPKVAVLDQGVGFARAEGLNVDWTVLGRNGRFGWTWAGQVNPQIKNASAFVFPDQGSAYRNLVENTGMIPLPRPMPSRELEGDDEDEDEDEVEGEVIEAEPATAIATAAFWSPPPEGSLMYPGGANPNAAPYLEDPEDLTFSDDCRIVVVGPDWWDKIGDFVSASPDTSANELLEMITETEFPADCDYDVGVGARQLRDELWERITEVATQE
jgi:hypothetical protein